MDRQTDARTHSPMIYRTHTHTHVCIYTHICTCRHTLIHTHTHTCMIVIFLAFAKCIRCLLQIIFLLLRFPCHSLVWNLPIYFYLLTRIMKFGYPYQVIISFMLYMTLKYYWISAIYLFFIYILHRAQYIFNCLFLFLFILLYFYFYFYFYFYKFSPCKTFLCFILSLSLINYWYDH